MISCFVFCLLMVGVPPVWGASAFFGRRCSYSNSLSLSDWISLSLSVTARVSVRLSLLERLLSSSWFLLGSKEVLLLTGLRGLDLVRISR